MSSSIIQWHFLFCFVSSCLIGFSQSKEYNKTSAEHILNNFCSEKQAYQTNDLDIEQPIGSCYGKDHMYGKWFKFKAEKSLVEIILKTGGQYGTTQFPYIYLWNESLTELACVGFSEDAMTDFLTLVYKNLEANQYYYIQVVNHNNADYKGTFTLCVSSKPSNDNLEGALPIEKLNHWCTSDFLTTSDGLPDAHKISCLDNGPNFNKWFSFIPKKKELQIIVLPKNTEGDFQFPYLGLFDQNFKEVDCARFFEQNKQQGAVLITDKLNIGEKYYVSVDHAPKKIYTGSFQLCFDDKSSEKYFKFFGKLKVADEVISMEDVTLYDQKNTLLYTLKTDRQGVVIIPQLSEEIAYIKTKRSDAHFQGLLLTEKNEIIQSTQQKEDKYILEKLPENCAQLALLECNNKHFKANTNKTALLGKVVHKENPMQDMRGVVVNIFTTDKKSIKTTTTDIQGGFYVDDLAIDQAYIVHLSAPDQEGFYAEILHINDQGKALKKTSSRDGMDENGFFHFEYLPYVNEKIKIKPMEDEHPIDFLSEEATVVLEHLFFRSNSSELMSSSEQELLRVYQYLIKNPKIRIEVMGFTDNTGSDEVNQVLSSERAKSVVQSLLKMGISDARLMYKGYGNANPLADNKNQEGRMKNRRVEIRILP